MRCSCLVSYKKRHDDAEYPNNRLQIDPPPPPARTGEEEDQQPAGDFRLRSVLPDRRERIGGGDGGVERGNVGLDDELGRRRRRGAVRFPDGAEAAAVARVRLDRAAPPGCRRRGAQPRRAVPPLRGRRHDGRPQIPHEGQHRPRLGRAGACGDESSLTSISFLAISRQDMLSISGKLRTDGGLIVLFYLPP